ncbi:MAG TPA: hypothetical protein VM183_16080 [Burkholderiales bacterium]|nr:hypothetical protein [Burkholderiales bacterium]
MLSPRRRQVIIGGIAAAVAPSTFAALPRREETLVLSGRLVGQEGKPVCGAKVFSGAAQAETDADGRFVLRTTSRRFRVTSAARVTEGFAANAHPDIDGTWRATLGLTL